MPPKEWTLLKRKDENDFELIVMIRNGGSSVPGTFYVNKYFLAGLSPVFKKMISDPENYKKVRTGQKILEDRKYEEIAELLQCIIPNQSQGGDWMVKEVSDRTIERMLRLGEDFQIGTLIQQCQRYMKLKIINARAGDPSILDLIPILEIPKSYAGTFQPLISIIAERASEMAFHEIEAREKDLPPDLVKEVYKARAKRDCGDAKNFRMYMTQENGMQMPGTGGPKPPKQMRMDAGGFATPGGPGSHLLADSTTNGTDSSPSRTPIKRNVLGSHVGGNQQQMGFATHYGAYAPSPAGWQNAPNPHQFPYGAPNMMPPMGYYPHAGHWPNAQNGYARHNN